MKHISVVISVVIMIFIAFMLNILYQYGTINNVNLTVNKSERVCTSIGEDQSCKYLIFADAGVFENTDTLLHFKFNSSDIYNQMKEGEAYNVTTYGWRVPFLSMYPNIIKID